MLSLGIDVGTSFIKLALFDDQTGNAYTVTVPEKEVPILVENPNWSEQDAAYWWELVQVGLKDLLPQTPFTISDIDCIGIAYQMHGLVLVDEAQKPLRNAIIWNDLRTQEVSEWAFNQLGSTYFESKIRNHPGSFTLSKLLWVKQHEPELVEKAHAFLLPGDFIAAQLTGSSSTTPSGLSEGTMWDFESQEPASIWEQVGLSSKLLPTVLPNFYAGLPVSKEAVECFGFKPSAKVSYRAGDQVNNGYFMGAVQEGVAVLSGGTSGVIYTVANQQQTSLDPRYNTFLHIHPTDALLEAQLVCINSLAISYRWVKNNLFAEYAGYEVLNELLEHASADGVYVLPFGNTSERILGGIPTTASIHGIDFNRHGRVHILRAFFESLLFVYAYSFRILKEHGVQVHAVHLSPNGVFKNPNFVQQLSNLLNLPVHVLEIDGAISAAKGAILGVDPNRPMQEAEIMETIQPEPAEELIANYAIWEGHLTKYLQQ